MIGIKKHKKDNISRSTKQMESKFQCRYSIIRTQPQALISVWFMAVLVTVAELNGGDVAL